MTNFFANEKIPLNFRYQGKRFVHHLVMNLNAEELKKALSKGHNIRLKCDQGYDVWDYLFFNEKRLQKFTNALVFERKKELDEINLPENFINTFFLLWKVYPDQLQEKKLSDFFYTIISKSEYYATTKEMHKEYVNWMYWVHPIIKRMKPIELTELNELPEISDRGFLLVDRLISMTQEKDKTNDFFQKALKPVILCKKENPKILPISALNSAFSFARHAGKTIFDDEDISDSLKEKISLFLKGLYSRDEQFKFFVKDLSNSNWINQQPSFVKSVFLNLYLNKLSSLPVSSPDKALSKI